MPEKKPCDECRFKRKGCQENCTMENLGQRGYPSYLKEKEREKERQPKQLDLFRGWVAIEKE